MPEGSLCGSPGVLLTPQLRGFLSGLISVLRLARAPHPSPSVPISVCAIGDVIRRPERGLIGTTRMRGSKPRAYSAAFTKSRARSPLESCARTNESGWTPNVVKWRQFDDIGQVCFTAPGSKSANVAKHEIFGDIRASISRPIGLPAFRCCLQSIAGGEPSHVGAARRK